MQELLGSVADLTWDEEEQHLSLTAACHLAANTPLTPALAAAHADPAYVLHTHGPSALFWAQERPKAQPRHTQHVHPQAPQQQLNNQRRAHSKHSPCDSTMHPSSSTSNQADVSQATLEGRLHPMDAAQQQQTCQRAWQASDAASYNLCLQPPEEDEAREHKLVMLRASALGTSHYLTMLSSQVRHSCYLGPL